MLNLLRQKEYNKRLRYSRLGQLCPIPVHNSQVNRIFHNGLRVLHLFVYSHSESRSGYHNLYDAGDEIVLVFCFILNVHFPWKALTEKPSCFKRAARVEAVLVRAT